MAADHTAGVKRHKAAIQLRKGATIEAAAAASGLSADEVAAEKANLGIE